jgi:hypothetical protein
MVDSEQLKKARATADYVVKHQSATGPTDVRVYQILALLLQAAEESLPESGALGPREPAARSSPAQE